MLKLSGQKASLGFVSSPRYKMWMRVVWIWIWRCRWVHVAAGKWTIVTVHPWNEDCLGCPGYTESKTHTILNFFFFFFIRSFPSSWHQKLQSCFCRYSATHTHTRTQSSLLFCWWKISFSKHTHTHIDGSARVCVFAHCLHTFGAGTKSRAFLFAILYANSKYLCNKKHPPTHPN